MDKEELRAVSAQLAHPSGDLGTDIADKMNDTNVFITACAIEALSPKEGESVVELGPGNGALSRDLVKAIGTKGYYLGIEISRDMAQLAKKTLCEVGVAKVEVHTGDCHTVLVDDASIDGLMAVNVLYFIDDLDRLLTQIRPWFKPNGRCVFGIRPKRTLEALYFHEFGFHIRSPEEIADVLRKYDFAEIDITQYDEGEGSLGDISFPKGTIIVKAIASA